MVIEALIDVVGIAAAVALSADIPDDEALGKLLALNGGRATNG